MIKFVGFYQTAEFVYDQIEKRTGTKKSEMSEASQLMVTFASGYWAGIFCALATQPMDNLVSMKGSPANQGKSFGQIAKEAGWKYLCTKGIGTRVIMIGTLTGLQVFVAFLDGGLTCFCPSPSGGCTEPSNPPWDSEHHKPRTPPS